MRSANYTRWVTDPGRSGSPRTRSKKPSGQPRQPSTGTAAAPVTPTAAGAADAEKIASRLRFAAAICLLEALAALAMAGVELASLDAHRLSAGVTTAVFFVLYAAGLAWSARGFARARSWSRGPIVLAQLIQLGVAWNFHGGVSTWVTVVLAIPAVVVLIVVFSPDTTTALYGSRRRYDEAEGPTDTAL